MPIQLDQDPNAFQVGDLLQHVRNNRLDEPIIGGQNVRLANFTKDYSLDYWFRTSVAQRCDRRQATVSVVNAICATGFFTRTPIVDPHTGRRCKAIVLTAAGRVRSSAM